MFADALIAGLRNALPLIIIVVAGITVIAILRSRLDSDPRSNGRISYPYRPRPALFTETEARFLEVLQEAVPELGIYGKVRLEDVIVVKRGLSQREHQSARNRIKSRHLDFVLVDPVSTRILCVLELDDHSHAQARARRTDAFKNRALAAASVPLLRVKAHPHYPAGDLRTRLHAIIRPPTNAE